MRTFFLTIALLSAGTVFASENTAVAHASDDLAAGDYFLALGTAADLKSAIIAYDRILRADPQANTREGALAAERTQLARKGLEKLAAPTLREADKHLIAEDWIAAERALCEALKIDPFNRAAKQDLADARAHLRAQTIEMLDDMYSQRPRPFRLPELGVPPAAERITNDPAFSVLPNTKDRG